MPRQFSCPDKQPGVNLSRVIFQMSLSGVEENDAFCTLGTSALGYIQYTIEKHLGFNLCYDSKYVAIRFFYNPQELFFCNRIRRILSSFL